MQKQLAELIADKIEELIKLMIEDEPNHESVGNTLVIIETKKELINMLKAI
jgi:hypothetical protein